MDSQIATSAILLLLLLAQSANTVWGKPHHMHSAEDVSAEETPEEEEPVNIFQRLTVDYPDRSRLREMMFPYVVHVYPRSRLHALALWNVTAENKTDACNKVHRYLQAQQLTENDEASIQSPQCSPIYKCDYDQMRFPPIMIDSDCTQSSCRKAELPRGFIYPVPGRCSPDLYNSIEVLKYIKYEEQADESEEKNSANNEGELNSKLRLEGTGGSGQGLKPSQGKWHWKRFSSASTCICAAK